VPTADGYRHAAELRSALRRFLRQSDAVARRHGLTTQRYELLLMAKTGRDGAERATLGELAERLALAPSSITELVARSEALGLVRRELDPSRRRVVFVAITAEGDRRLRAAVDELEGERAALAEIVAKETGGSTPTMT
jgi:DNA-binding MarR family transcriptional regulator